MTGMSVQMGPHPFDRDGRNAVCGERTQRTFCGMLDQVSVPISLGAVTAYVAWACKVSTEFFVCPGVQPSLDGFPAKPIA